MEEDKLVESWFTTTAIDRNSAENSLKYLCCKYLSICEEMRRIYDIIHDMPENDTKANITDLLITAFVMAKKMNSRLEYYRDKYNDNTGSAAGNLKPLEDYEERRAKRRARIK